MRRRRGIGAPGQCEKKRRASNEEGEGGREGGIEGGREGGREGGKEGGAGHVPPWWMPAAKHASHNDVSRVHWPQCHRIVPALRVPEGVSE